MNTKTLTILVWLLFAGLLICSGMLIHQHFRLTEQALHISEIEKELELWESRRILISEASAQLLAPGIYSLDLELSSDPSKDEKNIYSLQHFTLNIEVGSVERKLQFGYARSGILTHVFYFDYNSDGVIDTDMMRDHVESIPFLGKIASQSIDLQLSQELYDEFRINADQAEYVAFDQIATDAGESAQAIWNWLNETSAEFADWIESKAVTN